MGASFHAIADKGGGPSFATWRSPLILVLALCIGGCIAGENPDSAGHGKARERLAEVQVLSQRIVIFAKEAASGNAAAFDELLAVRDGIRSNLDLLLEGGAPARTGTAGADGQGVAGYRHMPRLQAPLRGLLDAWRPIDQQVQTILDHRELVLGLFETTSTFSATLPQLQAQMDEVARSMGDSDAPSAQVYMAVRQIVLAGRMQRHLEEIVEGGANAVSAADHFARDAAGFDYVLTGLLEGNEEGGITRVANPQARILLDQMAELYSGARKEVDRILDASTELLEVKEASDEIFVGSSRLLEGARGLDAAIASLPDDA